MNLFYIGAGFVGTCSAVISADSGHNVLLYDIDLNRIKRLSSNDRQEIESCIYEDGLADMLVRHQDRIDFTADYQKVEEFLDICDGIFLCLPTPEIGETGESNLSYYTDAAQKLAHSLVMRNTGTQKKYVVIINKSTVPIDMVDKTAEILNAAGVKNYGIVSNPEFLVEGKAIEGSLRPDRVVIGAWKQQDFDIMRKIYQRFYDSPTVEYIEVNPKEAAAGKLLANYILFSKLALTFDVIGRTCETFTKLGFENIRKVLTTDPRIGTWGMYNSLYAGGSCFIKDARSLYYQLQTAGQEANLVNEVYLANRRQFNTFMGRAQKEAGFVWKDKIVALIGLAFKRDTNDIRNSPSIDIANFLKEQEVKKVQVYDPAAMDNFKLVFPENAQFTYFSHEFDTVKNADVIIIATDWPQFRGLADAMIREFGYTPLIMDGRRILQHRYKDLHEAGFTIIAVGGPLMKSAQLSTD
ncbi:MAG: UDP-glucose/GDP-mannose dehydrogenase family protein [Planctomycetes bacterium]|nr:UDP-glucose/GDP-mannose dehydrogenase family protein [Planctomycetota bacterium]